MTLSAAMAPLRARAHVWAPTPAVIVGVAAAPVLAVNGGYYPTSWGWAAAALAWGAVVVAALREHSRPSRYELLFVGGLAAFVGWLVVSMAWTANQTATPLEIERSLVYVAGALAVLAIVGREQVRPFLGALCAGSTLVCAYGLATRLFPDHFVTDKSIVGQRLASPVGYWNGLGLVAAMSLLLALTFVGRARSWPGAAVAGAAVPVLCATLYFTFSRGSWLALAVGVVVLLATDRRRLQLVFATTPLAAIGALVVWESSHRPGLTHTNATLAAAAHQGHRLAALVLAAAVIAACVAVSARAVERRWSIPGSVRTAAPWVTAGAVALALALVFAHYGSPIKLAHRAYHSWTSNLSTTTSLNQRLFSFSNHGRLSAWKVGIQAFEAHPLGGIGAGGFGEYWAQHRTTAVTITDAHSLYVETLAETGIVGLVLLVGALVAPLAGFRRARGEPLAAAALAAFVAYLAAAAVDWDWELSGVTLVALLCGGALLAAGRGDAPPGRARFLPLALGSLVALAAVYGLVGNLYLSAAVNAASAGDLQRAAAKAHAATRWMPWSATPWQQLGEAQLALGRVAAARASFETAIAKDPRDEDLWLDLAEASGGRAQAAALAQAQRLDPRDDTPALLRQQLGGRPAFSGGKG